ncbi:Protein kinase-like domain-containing protein [Cynara cardunculus var. scolymus]|uniref:Protein kinase-like domain-containing protein n=1 Tax=Cynara cardunculus var. scolymus TaxID=59895 RepID=A0A124SF95_CYNCS|nr:Protein kinase-like domain-containing protein [Cynara cardunculus var. scolymus]
MDCQKLMLTTFILMFFWFTGSIKNTVSQPSSADCPLDLRYFTRPQNFTCEEGTWNDFLHDKCCKGPFNMYLDALALRANQTLQIYLNSTEQTSCLMQMKDNITDVFSCGIDKLTNGINGCSDFSVQDVLTELHAEFEGLLAGCGLLGHEGDGDGWRRACGNCVQSWKEIKGITSRDGDADLCRFAVLTSLTGSRIDDFVWMQNIHKCLGEQVMDKGMKRDLPKKSQYLEVPHVAVKHIINDGFVETFLREVRNLALVRHPNLVALLGYCDNGKNKVLSWIQRLEIAIDCARGLWFLHTYSEGCIAKSLTKGGSIVGFADPKLESEYSADAFELTFKLALSCTGHKQERPSMEKTVEQLEKSHEISVSQMTSYLHKT